MVDMIVILILALIIGSAMFYIVKEKKKGTKCIGCPMAGQCSRTCDSDKGKVK
ncbi:MAG: FeoB-associated Cys-rich membrane protein [Lachnospiraceae bacterium]|nr:FeoB-associated Cys-rich membrane protein [Lachnospiraceae bacterium]